MQSPLRAMQAVSERERSTMKGEIELEAKADSLLKSQQVCAAKAPSGTPSLHQTLLFWVHSHH